MGASAEILWDADRQGLRVVEVPIEVDYPHESSSTGPVRHAMSVIVSMVRYVETERPLAFFAVPGVILFIVGIALGIRVLDTYYSTPIELRELPMGTALLTLLVTLLGVLLSFTGLILHAVINANKRKR